EDGDSTGPVPMLELAAALIGQALPFVEVREVGEVLAAAGVGTLAKIEGDGHGRLAGVTVQREFEGGLAADRDRRGRGGGGRRRGRSGDRPSAPAAASTSTRRQGGHDQRGDG